VTAHMAAAMAPGERGGREGNATQRDRSDGSDKGSVKHLNLLVGI
jgi:hypothetical protein